MTVPPTERRLEAIGHAADLLRSGGPPALTSVAVAERMGITQSAVYRHIRDMDELTALASARVVAELNAVLEGLLLSPTIDWHHIDDVGRLCRSIVTQIDGARQAFEVVDRWRFVDGDLGAGIRTIVEQGNQLLAFVLESRWRTEFGHTEPLSIDERTAQRAHAQLIYADGHAVARLLRAEDRILSDEALAQLLEYRVLTGWASYVIDMNERVGLRFPRISFDDAHSAG